MIKMTDWSLKGKRQLGEELGWFYAKDIKTLRKKLIEFFNDWIKNREKYANAEIDYVDIVNHLFNHKSNGTSEREFRAIKKLIKRKEK